MKMVDDKIIEEIREDIKKYSKYPERVRIVAATKYTDCNGIREVLAAGIRDIGENRVQAMSEKLEELQEEMSIKWNFIGHLQKNKVKYIIDSVSLIHSVDSLELAAEIDKRAAKIGRVVNILIEMNIAGEESKHGYSITSLMGEAKEYLKFQNIKVCGLMGMAPNTEESEIIRDVFRKLRETMDILNRDIFQNSLTELSMGMSNDYKIALEEGATLIRIGSKIFK